MRPISPADPDSGGSAPRPGAPPQSWAARYGQIILRDGIAAIPNALYFYQGALALSAQEVWFTSYILAHKWDADLPYPSLNRMAACTGVDLSWLKRIRRSLGLKGLLAVQTRYTEQGRQEANSYDFAGLFAELEAQIAAEGPAPNPIQSPAEPDSDPEEPARDGSFSARYGRIIARVGVAAVPRALFTHQAALGLTPQQVWFIGYILAHRWSTDLPHPSLVRMAERTGYGVRQLHNIKDSLVAPGYLALVRRYSATGGKDTNGYDFSGLLDAVTGLLQQERTDPRPSVPPVADLEPEVPARRRRHILRPSGTPAGAQPRDGAPTSADLPAAAHREGAPPLHRGGVSGVHKDEGPGLHIGEAPSLQQDGAPALPMGEAQAAPHRARPVPVAPGAPSLPIGGGSGMHIGEERRLHKGQVAVAQGRGATAAQGRGAAPAYKEESDQESPQEERDSNRASSRQGGFTLDAGLRYSPYIAAVILDHSRELGDTSHGPSNVSQALRHWQASGLPEPAFVERLHEARRRVRAYQGKQGAGSIGNKMAYYFRVVAQLSGE